MVFTDKTIQAFFTCVVVPALLLKPLRTIYLTWYTKQLNLKRSITKNNKKQVVDEKMSKTGKKFIFRQIITVRTWFRSKELKEERQKILSFISFVTTTNERMIPSPFANTHFSNYGLDQNLLKSIFVFVRPVFSFYSEMKIRFFGGNRFFFF